MTIVEFLLARIGEDEQNARAIGKEYGRWDRERAVGGPDGSQGSILVTAIAGSPAEPARMLRECDAKRRIVDAYWGSTTGWDEDSDLQEGRSTGLSEAVCMLATIYADHPDYDPNWKWMP